MEIRFNSVFRVNNVIYQLAGESKPLKLSEISLMLSTLSTGVTTASTRPTPSTSTAMGRERGWSSGAMFGHHPGTPVSFMII